MSDTVPLTHDLLDSIDLLRKEATRLRYEYNKLDDEIKSIVLNHSSEKRRDISKFRSYLSRTLGFTSEKYHNEHEVSFSSSIYEWHTISNELASYILNWNLLLTTRQRDLIAMNAILREWQEVDNRKKGKKK